MNFNVDRTIADQIGAQKMLPSVVDQNSNDQHNRQGAQDFDKVQVSSLETADDDFHPDMTAEFLAIGDPQEGKGRHR